MKTLKPEAILENDSINEILFDLLYNLFESNEGYLSAGFGKITNDVYVYFPVNEKHLILCTQTENHETIKLLRSPDDTIRVYNDSESALDYAQRMVSI